MSPAELFYDATFVLGILFWVAVGIGMLCWLLFDRTNGMDDMPEDDDDELNFDLRRRLL